MEQIIKKILIIGEDSDLQGLLIEMITRIFDHFNTFSTAKGLSGIEMASALQPDVVLISTLKNDLNSFELCRNFKNDEILQDVPLVFIPGSEDKQLRIKAYEAGFDSILSSAADEEELAACIRAMLNLKEVNDARKAETKRLLHTIDERAKELQESEWQLLEAQSIAHIGHWKLDIESNQLHWSDEVYRIFGYIPREFSPTYEDFLNSVHPLDKEFVHKAYLNSLEQKNLYNIEHRVLLKDGSVKYVSESCLTYYDPWGNPKQSIGTVKDITERKQIELRLEAELKHLEGIIAGTNVGTWEWNVQTGEAVLNERWAEIIGYTLEEISPISFETWVKFAHPDDVVKSQELLQAHFRGEMEFYEFESRMRHKNGDWVWVMEKGKVISRNDEGQPLMMFGTHLDITERKLNELRLEAERNRLAAIIQGTNVGTWEWNILTGETVFNERWAEIIGYTLEEISPVSIDIWEKFTHPDDFRKSNQILEAHFRGELEYYECEARMRHKNGQWVWVLDKGKVISRTVDGKPLAMFGTHLDINERKLIEQRLHESEAQFRGLFEHAADAIFIADEESGVIVHANQKAASLLKCPIEEIIGKHQRQLHPQQADNFYETSFQKHKSEIRTSNLTKPITTRVRCANGTEVPVEVLASEVFYRGRNCIMGIFRDITERILAEEELQIKNRAIETSINAIAMADLSGNLTYVNPAFLKLWKYQQPGEVIGRASFEFWENREDPLAVIEALRKQGFWQGEMLACRSDKSLFVAEVSANLIKDQDGKPICLQASFIDITARKQAEEALQQAADIIHHMQIGLYVYQLENPEDDRSLRLLATNPSSRKLSGVAADESIGKYIDEIFPALRSQGIPKRFADVVRTGIAGEFEDYYYTPEKVLEAAYMVKAFPLPNHCVGITFDNITERKKDEILLSASEEKYRKLISTVPDLIVLTDIQGNITFINNVPFPSFSHLPVDSFIGQNILSFVSEDDLPEAIANSTLMFESKLGPKEYKLKTSGGNFIQTEVNGDVIFDAQNNPIGMIYAIRDITERLQSEKAVRLSEERFKSIVAVSNTGAWEFHHDTDFLWCSAEYFTMLGYNPADFNMDGSANIQKNWIDLLHPDDRIKAPKHFAEYLASGSVGIYENYFRMRHQDGSWVWIWSRGQTLRDTDGNLTRHTLGTHIDITERMLAQQQLLNEKEKAESNENRLIEAQAVTKVGSWETDLATLKVFWSDETYKIFELDPLYFSPDHNSFLSFVHPEDRDKVDEAFRLSFTSDQHSAVEHRIISANGKVKYAEERWRIIKDRQGNPIKAFGTCQDITERKQIEIELIKAKEKAEHSEKKFTAIADTSPLAIYISKGIRQVAEYINPAFYNIFGYTYEEVSEVALWWPLAYPDPEYQKQVSEEWNRKADLAIKNKSDIEPMEVVVRCKDGSDKNILWGFVSTGDENWAFGMDLTAFRSSEKELIAARKNAEKREEKISIQNQEILFNNERLESLLKVSQLQTDSVQELLDFALSQAVELTRSKIGYIYFYLEEKKQFILNTWSKDVMKECQVMEPQTIYDLDQTGCWGEAVRQRKPIVINDYQAENPLKKGTPEGHVSLQKFLTIPVIFDQKIVAVAGVANKSEDYNDSDVRQLTLLMDNVWKISERLTLIRDLQRAKEKAEESDRLKSAFLANMSHEIRTPMNGILGFAELLNEPDLTGEEQKQFIALINKSGQRMLNIINDIVDISKIESGIMETRLSETNIHEQMDFIYNFFKPDADAKGVELVVRNLLPGKAFALMTDREKLYAILTNLVKNAIKYTHKGSVEMGCEYKGNFIEFYVKDTGIGIPQHRQQAIFERFIQADIEDKMAYQGAGLGLTISHKYVEMLGGEMKVESTEGVGSTFFFTIPGNQQKPTSPAATQPDPVEKPVEIRKLKVLAVDDDEVSEMLLDKIINKISREVLKARTGTEAVEIAKENPDIELILMDIRMPGMSGYEATKAIRQFNKDVVIIAQTAFGLSGDRRKAMEAGCTDYITKPISKNDLFTIVQRYFKA